MTSPAVNPSYEAARAGLPGDSTAVNHASQVDQFLASHGVIPVYQGNRVWTVGSPSSSVITNFFWIDAANVGSTAGWLPVSDVDQPFTGLTAVGRIEAAVQAIGAGADLQVTLYPDNGSGSPDTTSPIASTVIPASHITQLSAAGSLASAGPLATARSNTRYASLSASTPWSQAAGSVSGPAAYAAPVTSGNWTLLLGGYDTTAAQAVTAVSGVQYLGGAAVSGAVPMPSLPQASWYSCACATADTVIFAGGTNQAGAHFANVWTASWAPGTGTLGAWSAQQALPQAAVNAAMVSRGSTVFVLGGSTAASDATATAAVWTASVSNGQITAWAAGPSLPSPLNDPVAAVVGDWLIVAGGISSGGTVLSATWYSAINGDGSLAGWQAGPALPQAVYAYSPGWNLAVTDSAMVIVSGIVSGGGASTCTQVLAVSADGPAPEWQLQNWYGAEGAGTFPCSAFQAGSPGEWELVLFHPSGYDSAPLYPVPLISVPLPASGLTAASTYHAVFHQLGGDAVNNYLQLGEFSAVSSLEWLYASRGSGGPWTSHTSHAVAMSIYDQTPGGSPLHLWQDAGARVTSFAWGGATGRLLGCLESTVFPAGAPEAVLASVVQMTYNSAGLPAGLVPLA